MLDTRSAGDRRAAAGRTSAADCPGRSLGEDGSGRSRVGASGLRSLAAANARRSLVGDLHSSGEEEGRRSPAEVEADYTDAEEDREKFVGCLDRRAGAMGVRRRSSAGEGLGCMTIVEGIRPAAEGSLAIGSPGEVLGLGCNLAAVDSHLPHLRSSLERT